MSKKFGLGKGLNALIPDEVSNNINSKKENNKDGVALIDINLIKNNNEQPRKLFDDEKILELMDSRLDLADSRLDSIEKVVSNLEEERKRDRKEILDVLDTMQKSIDKQCF